MKCFLRAFIAPIFFCLFFALYPNFSLADISQIGFTTKEQTVKPNATSAIITVQTQDSSGSLFSLSETGYLSVISSSPTGHFYSNTTTASSTNTFTMNKGSANKNFYYRDSSYGTFTITATLKTWTATQNITISDQANSSSTSETNTPISVESHTAIEELSSVEGDSVATFEVGAGRERTVYVDSPVFFKANYYKSKNLSPIKIFSWNFGDGYSENREEVVHSYKHSGEYEVVLNASVGNAHGSSRTKVTVLEPSLEMTILPDESISLENLGKYEVNIGGFNLMSYYREYTFPDDTIIGVGKKIIFDKDCTKLSVADNTVEFLDPQNKVLLTYEPERKQAEEIFVLGTTTQNISLEDFGKKDLASADEVDKLVKVLTLINKEKVVNNATQVYQVPKSDLVETISTTSSDENAPMAQEKKTSFWSKILHFPATVFYGIFGAFYTHN